MQKKVKHTKNLGLGNVKLAKVCQGIKVFSLQVFGKIYKSSHILMFSKKNKHEFLVINPN